MRNQVISNDFLLPFDHLPRRFFLGVLLVVSLFAFELFNFDTTQYALRSLLGDVRLAGIGWATILAVAFCAIDFAGLAHLLAPEQSESSSKGLWYLMGAWLLGATMNAMMTWWAVSLALLSHPLGNEVLSREQLLHWAPIFVAVLVWLTRILFIGSLSMAGEHLSREKSSRPVVASRPTTQPARLRPKVAHAPAIVSQIPATVAVHDDGLRRRAPVGVEPVRAWAPASASVTPRRSPAVMRVEARRRA